MVCAGKKQGRIYSKRAELGSVSDRLHLQDHQQSRERIVRVNKKTGRAQMIAPLLAKPPDDLHAAIGFIHVDEDLTTQVVIEMDLVPGFDQPGKTLLHCLNPDGLRVFAQESLRTRGVVIQKENPAWRGWPAV